MGGWPVAVAAATPGFGLRKLHPAIGAEILGVDLREPQSEDAIDALRQAWRDHHLLVFPGQAIGDEQQIAFSRRFGELELFPQKDNRAGVNPLILRVSNCDEQGELLGADHPTVVYLSLVEHWHTDSGYRAIPSLGAVLHGVEVVEEGGETQFANLLAAYDALPEATKRRVEHLKSRHSFEFSRSLRDLPPMKPEEAASVPPVWHPLTRVHPDRGGRRSLYLNWPYVDAIEGMDFEAARRLITELTDFAAQPQFVYRHKWRKDDVLMWDNRVTMHQVTPYDAGRRKRIMHRTSLQGTGPVFGPS
jgi:alpha-ketoglutarate-dependent taurine dioxygenase